jgi:hypothetical protein
MLPNMLIITTKIKQVYNESWCHPSDGTPLELFGGKGSIATFVVAAYMNSIPMIYNDKK